MGRGGEGARGRSDRMVDIVKRFHIVEREENRRNGETVQNWTVGCGKITTRGVCKFCIVTLKPAPDEAFRPIDPRGNTPYRGSGG